MEFVNRKACIEHYQEQFPNLPRYMVEMALDYDLSNGAESNEKQLTGKQKRQRKKALADQPKRDTSIQDMIAEAVKSGKPLEIDSAQVVKKEDYAMAPLVKGYISTEGILEQLEEQEEELPGHCFTEGPGGALEVDDFLIHRDEECEENSG
jgi:hypothetical protein